MRVFKNKWFNRWSRCEDISDVILCHTAKEIVAGNVDADIGGCLFKKRLPRAGEGKRGGYRVIVGYRRPSVERIIFLYAFSKSDKDNISGKEEDALSLAAESFVSASNEQVSRLLEKKSVWEVPCNE